MKCRPGCGACCIAISISSPIPGMPGGKPAGMRCINLTFDNKCKIYGTQGRPRVCIDLKPEPEICGKTSEEAYANLSLLEKATLPQKI
ncbi:MAG: YkgJ family cysteine cluster protein [Bacillota bacterium]